METVSGENCSGVCRIDRVAFEGSVVRRGGASTLAGMKGKSFIGGAMSSSGRIANPELPRFVGAVSGVWVLRDVFLCCSLRFALVILARALRSVPCNALVTDSAGVGVLDIFLGLLGSYLLGRGLFSSLCISLAGCRGVGASPRRGLDLPLRPRGVAAPILFLLSLRSVLVVEDRPIVRRVRIHLEQMN